MKKIWLAAVPITIATGAVVFLSAVNAQTSQVNTNDQSSQDSYLPEGADKILDSTPTSANESVSSGAKPSTVNSVSQKTDTQNTGSYQISEEDRKAMEKARADIAAQQDKVRLAKCDNIRLQHESDITTEDARHSSQVEWITRSYRSRGLGLSGEMAREIEQENAVHMSNVNNIDTEFNRQTKQISC